MENVFKKLPIICAILIEPCITEMILFTVLLDNPALVFVFPLFNNSVIKVCKTSDVNFLICRSPILGSMCIRIICSYRIYVRSRTHGFM